MYRPGRARLVPTRLRPTRPDPALTLFDGLFLSHFKRYKFEILTCFELKKFISFQIKVFLIKSVFSLFSKIFGYTSGTPFLFEIWLFHMKKRWKKFQNHFSFLLKSCKGKVKKLLLISNRPISTWLFSKIGSKWA